MGPEKETSSPARSSLSLLTFFGILASFCAVVCSFRSKGPKDEHHAKSQPQRRIQSEDIPPLTISVPDGVETSRSAADVKQDADHQDKLVFWQRWTFWAVFVYAGIAGLQYHQMVIATDLEQRPYLVGAQHPEFVQSIAPDQQIQVNYTFTNTGRTPVVSEITDLHLIRFPVSPGDDVAQERVFRQFLDTKFKEMRDNLRRLRGLLAQFPQGGGFDMAPNNWVFSTSQDKVTLSVTDIAELGKDQPPFVLLFVSASTYRDKDGTPYETDICQFYLGTHPQVWHRCDGYNHIK